MVEEGDPKRRGAEHDEDDEGWGDVETELELILIEVIVVAPPAPEPATSSPVAGFDGIVVTETSVDAGPPKEDTLDFDVWGLKTTDEPPLCCFVFSRSPRRFSSSINLLLVSSKEAIFCCCI